MKEIIVACVLFIISAIVLVLSIRSFKNKGFLLNNAFIYASQKEREAMDKSKYYRQSGVCLLLVSLAFAFNGAAVLSRIDALFGAVGVLFAVAAVYAIVSSIKLSK